MVAASPGYPRSYPKGHVIMGCDDAAEVNGVSAVYHAGTKVDGSDVVTSGGRVLTVTGTGTDLKAALDAAYGGLEKIEFEGMHYRKDIGGRALAALILLVQRGVVVEHAPLARCLATTTTRRDQS